LGQPGRTRQGRAAAERRQGRPAEREQAGGAIHVIGMAVVAMNFNGLLNNALAAVDLSNPNAAAIRAIYLWDWTFWDKARTVASLAGCVMVIRAVAII
jgi:uncharacterized membrane protein